MQDYPGMMSGVDGVNEGMRVQYFPPLSHWLLPCRRLQRLEVAAPDVRLAPRMLARLPALQHLSLETNIVKGEEGMQGFQLELEPLDAPKLASSSLTSLVLNTSYSQLQASGRRGNCLPNPVRWRLPAADTTPVPGCSPACWRPCRACAAWWPAICSSIGMLRGERSLLRASRCWPSVPAAWRSFM